MDHLILYLIESLSYGVLEFILNNIILDPIMAMIYIDAWVVLRGIISALLHFFTATSDFNHP